MVLLIGPTDLEGVVTGIVDFGLFVKLGNEEESIEGLVHISEIAWGRVTDINSVYKVGDPVKVLVVSTADNRVSLSIKRLLPDPWQEAASKYKIGENVSGQVTRVTPFGVFVRLDTEIDGLVHISEISTERITDPGTILHMGETFEFKIISIDPQQHRLGLSYKRLNEPEEVVGEDEKPKKSSAKKRVKKKLSDTVDDMIDEPIVEPEEATATESPETTEE